LEKGSCQVCQSWHCARDCPGSPHQQTPKNKKKKKKPNQKKKNQNPQKTPPLSMGSAAFNQEMAGVPVVPHCQGGWEDKTGRTRAQTRTSAGQVPTNWKNGLDRESPMPYEQGGGWRVECTGGGERGAAGDWLWSWKSQTASVWARQAGGSVGGGGVNKELRRSQLAGVCETLGPTEIRKGKKGSPGTNVRGSSATAGGVDEST